MIAILMGSLGTGLAGVGGPARAKKVRRGDQFPISGHFIHDAGPFQVGIAASLLRWPDSIGVVLAAFLVANSVHTVNYIADLRLGGHPADAWGLGALSVITAAALVARGRHIKARESPAQVRSVRATDRRCSKNDAKAMP